MEAPFTECCDKIFGLQSPGYRLESRVSSSDPQRSKFPERSDLLKNLGSSCLSTEHRLYRLGSELGGCIHIHPATQPYLACASSGNPLLSVAALKLKPRRTSLRGGTAPDSADLRSFCGGPNRRRFGPCSSADKRPGRLAQAALERSSVRVRALNEGRAWEERQRENQLVVGSSGCNQKHF